MPKTVPHKKLIEILPGQSAIVVENKHVDSIIEAAQIADQAEAVEHFEQIFNSATIITN